jgi:ABC-2 type transport system ATP-binding protein
MTTPSTRPARKRVGRKGGAPDREPGAAPRRAREGEDRPRAPIRTRGLTKEYGDLVAVDHLDLEVQAGEIFGLLGQNGAGKTTTILMLLGLTEPTEGQARVVGLDPARRPLEVKRRVGYLPDAVGFYGDLTGRENLQYTARLNRIPRDEARGTIAEALEAVGLTARADDATDTYSRGMLQRLGIADALIKDPDVLILDEPTTAIDPLGVTEILELLRNLVRDRQMAILLSSHLLNQVQSVCDRIGIFAAGRLIGQGTMHELAARFGDDTAHVEADIAPPEDGGVERVREVLGAIAGVSEVKAPARPIDPWVVDVKPSTEDTRVRREILAAAALNGFDLTSVRPVPPSLEDIYRRAVERAAHGHARDVR